MDSAQMPRYRMQLPLAILPRQWNFGPLSDHAPGPILILATA